MLRESRSYTVDSRNTRPLEVVSIPVSLYKSTRGRYFVGQTDTLQAGNGASAWAGLVNPRNSGVNLYANVFTISNFSNEYLTAQIWLNTTFPESASVSDKVSPANTSLRVIPQNNVNIRFIRTTALLPQNGVNVYERIVPPNTTLVSEEDGKFIEAPGGSYAVIIKSSKLTISEAVVAFGWWEKPR